MKVAAYQAPLLPAWPPITSAGSHHELKPKHTECSDLAIPHGGTMDQEYRYKGAQMRYAKNESRQNRARSRALGAAERQSG